MLNAIIGSVKVIRERVEIDFKLHISQFLGTMGYGVAKPENSLGRVMNGKILTDCLVAKNE